MYRSRLIARCRSHRSVAAAAIALALSFMPEAALPQPRSNRENPDWPCHQILVGKVSPAAVWSGPSVEGVAWRNDPAIADLVAQLAARRTPLEDAERLIGEFAKAQGSDKAKKLTAVFAGLFDTLNDERAQAIEGLLRFGAKQRELAAKIRTENSVPQENAAKEPPGKFRQGAGASASELEWDLRVFDERRQSIGFVCETPTLIEQRLFALAKVIQRNLGVFGEGGEILR
jgi:hypothetical protein